MLLARLFAQEEAKRKGDCGKPLEGHRTPCCQVNLTGRFPEFSPQCPKCSALEIVPLISDRFFDVINARNYHQGLEMLACENFYTGRWVVDECCKDVCGEISELLGDFYTQERKFKSRIVKIEYNEKDASVLVSSLVMQLSEDELVAEKMYFSKMLFMAEVFCDYRVNYWNLVEFTCSEGGEYRYAF